MRLRWSVLLVALAVAAVAAGAAYLEKDPGVRPIAARSAGAAPSGAWFCPHGGGPEGWGVKLRLTNPGIRPVSVRVRTLGPGPPGEPRDFVVAGESVLSVAVVVETRAAGSVVEHFGGWVGAGWVARAGGGDSGVAAEPCVPAAGTRWLLPDGTTLAGQRAWVVVMNPFGSEAVVGLSLVAESRTVRVGETTLAPGRVVAFHLNDLAEGERTVATVVEVSLGRVAAASLGFAEDGGVRAAVGTSGGSTRAVLPGALDAGGSLVPVLNPTDRGTGYGVSAMTPRGTIPSEEVTGEPLGPVSIRTEELTLPVPSTVVVQADSDVALAVARRTLGLRGDHGATSGAVPEAAWVVATAKGERDDTSRVVLANPGPEPVTVRLSAFGPQGPVGGPVQVEVPAGAAVEAPPRLTEDAPFPSVVAVAEAGHIVAAAVSYSPSATGYAVSLGVPIPPRWIP